MKTKHLLISFAVLMFVSCNQKPKYELDGLANPLLDEWFDCFKAADNSFSAKNFTPVYLSEKPEKAIEFSKDWYVYEPYFEKWYNPLFNYNWHYRQFHFPPQKTLFPETALLWHCRCNGSLCGEAV